MPCQDSTPDSPGSARATCPGEGGGAAPVSVTRFPLASSSHCHSSLMVEGTEELPRTLSSGQLGTRLPRPGWPWAGPSWEGADVHDRTPVHGGEQVVQPSAEAE